MSMTLRVAGCFVGCDSSGCEEEVGEIASERTGHADADHDDAGAEGAAAGCESAEVAIAGGGDGDDHVPQGVGGGDDLGAGRILLDSQPASAWVVAVGESDAPTPGLTS
jgi:hypothetical protein